MLTLVTSSPDKAKEFARTLPDVQIVTRALELPEIQSLSLEEIVRAKASAAFAEIGTPVLVDDVSFEIGCLNGFPGPFVKFFAKQVGYERTLQLAEVVGDFSARGVCGVGYADGTRVLYVEGDMRGSLTARTEGDGWGFDFYFIPEGSNETFAQMGREAKVTMSHRGNALRAMQKVLRTEGIL